MPAWTPRVPPQPGHRTAGKDTLKTAERGIPDVALLYKAGVCLGTGAATVEQFKSLTDERSGPVSRDDAAEPVIFLRVVRRSPRPIPSMMPTGERSDKEHGWPREGPCRSFSSSKLSGLTVARPPAELSTHRLR
jgi:hypothetical protein